MLWGIRGSLGDGHGGEEGSRQPRWQEEPIGGLDEEHGGQRHD